MRYAVRASLPDRPGSLGDLVAALSRYGLDILHFAQVDRYEGVAVDDVEVECDMDARAVRRVFEVLPGVALESLAPLDAVGQRLAPTALAAAMAEAPGAALQRLVNGLPAALAGQWAVAAADELDGLRLLAASSDAPAVPAGLALPFLPLRGARRLPAARWMPPEWRGGEPVEMAVASLHGPHMVVLLARVGGPRFRPGELQCLAELARVATAIIERAQPQETMVL